MGGQENNDFKAYIDSCFDWKDEKTNYTEGLSCLQGFMGKYTKKDILSFVNDKLNCNFDCLEVINEGLHVHSTQEPLCVCEA